MTAPSPGPAHAPQQDHPPKPRFALAVGVVGHKLNFWRKKDSGEDDGKDKDKNKKGPQLPPEEQLKNVTVNVEAALTAIQAAVLQSTNDHGAYFEVEKKDGKDIPTPPVLTLVSALADGADSIAAEAARKLGYQLDAPLPFAKEEYKENDFKTPQAKAAFIWLLGQARSVLELPGRRTSATGNSEDDKIELNRAYEAAGLTVLSQADIVLAVWDGSLSRGRGGTAELVAEAARAGMPIVLVDANGLLPVELRWRGLMETPAAIVAIDDLPRQPLEDCINRVIDELVRLPAAPEQRDGYARWQAETRHSVNPFIAFPMLMTMLVARLPKFADVLPEPPEKLAKRDYIDMANGLATADKQQIAALAEPYGWADAVGTNFAQVFRSAFVTNFIFAAAAVMAALASVYFLVVDAAEERKPFSWRDLWSVHQGLVLIEIALIVIVVGTTMLGRWRRWHRRWVEAREVAERLRGALPLWTLGLRPAFFPGEEPTWTGWYTRAVVRMHGLRAGKIASDRSPEREVLLTLLDGQAAYNEKNVVRMRRAERRLERSGLILFGATALVAIDHLFGSPELDCLLHGWLPTHQTAIWLSAALPSLATALYGIRIIGDFEGTVHRNEHTAQNINQLIAAIKQDPTGDFALLRARARSAADVLLGDVQSWRLAAESRGLAIPG